MDSSDFKKTTRRVMSRRGVLWLGQTCNLRCKFCYFIDRVKDRTHPEHPFMTLEKAKRICKTLVDYYQNNAVDIQGGEPTIYPDIETLVTHCRSIGLLPTLITNGIVLADARSCDRLHEAGVRDYLISVHGLGEMYDSIVGVPGAATRQMRAIENLREMKIPFRFNCVLSKWTMPDLEKISQIAAEKGARVLNFIVFNPFEDQRKKGRRSSDNVPRHSEITPLLTRALDILDMAGIEANVRYFPFCLLEERHRKSIQNFQQVIYDIHEWDYASGSWTCIESQKMKEGELSPVVSLEEATERLVSYRGCMKYIAGAAKAAAARFPKFKEPMKKVRQGIHAVIGKSLKAHETKSDPEELYRTHAKRRASASYVYGAACSRCDLSEICDGFQTGYARIFGTDEARAVAIGSRIQDPRHFILRQEKVVEQEDYGWAL